MEQAKAAVEDSIEEALKASKAATDSILDMSPGQAIPLSTMHESPSCQAISAVNPSIRSSGLQQDKVDVHKKESCFSLQCIAYHIVSGCRADWR